MFTSDSRVSNSLWLFLSISCHPSHPLPSFVFSRFISVCFLFLPVHSLAPPLNRPRPVFYCLFFLPCQCIGSGSLLCCPTVYFCHPFPQQSFLFIPFCLFVSFTLSAIIPSSLSDFHCVNSAYPSTSIFCLPVISSCLFPYTMILYPSLYNSIINASISIPLRSLPSIPPSLFLSNSTLYLSIPRLFLSFSLLSYQAFLSLTHTAFTPVSPSNPSVYHLSPLLSIFIHDNPLLHLLFLLLTSPSSLPLSYLLCAHFCLSHHPFCLPFVSSPVSSSALEAGLSPPCLLFPATFTPVSPRLPLSTGLHCLPPAIETQLKPP